MIDLYKKITTQYLKKLPFVVYNKPNDSTIAGLFQYNDQIHHAKKFNEVGFIMAPFDNRREAVLIPKEHSESYSIPFEKKEMPEIYEARLLEENKTSREGFEKLVHKALVTIASSTLEKVVVSRQEKIVLSKFDLIVVLDKLLNKYSQAFTFCWFHPKIGLWMGATPEQFIKVSDLHFKTVALAGTQKYGNTKNVVWETKEQEEQRFVTDYIVQNFKHYTSEMTISAPYTVRAGSLLHLKTDIEGMLYPDFELKPILDRLHPTPALCGVPKTSAKKFILENETYDRTFYTGFLGELNYNFKNNKATSDLYVNLRSMSIKDNIATLFVGCGIHQGSIPEKEWQESVNKSMIMRDLLK